jgi:hypothetical protein
VSGIAPEPFNEIALRTICRRDSKLSCIEQTRSRRSLDQTDTTAEPSRPRGSPALYVVSGFEGGHYVQLETALVFDVEAAERNSDSSYQGKRWGHDKDVTDAAVVQRAAVSDDILDLRREAISLTRMAMVDASAAEHSSFGV